MQFSTLRFLVQFCVVSFFLISRYIQGKVTQYTSRHARFKVSRSIIFQEKRKKQKKKKEKTLTTKGANEITFPHTHAHSFSHIVSSRISNERFFLNHSSGKWICHRSTTWTAHDTCAVQVMGLFFVIFFVVWCSERRKIRETNTTNQAR